MSIQELIQLRNIIKDKHSSTIKAIKALDRIDAKYGLNIDGMELHEAWTRETHDLNNEIAILNFRIVITFTTIKRQL